MRKDISLKRQQTQIIVYTYQNYPLHRLVSKGRSMIKSKQNKERKRVIYEGINDVICC